jgi:hypothetical protein
MCITLQEAEMTTTIVGGSVNYKQRTHTLLYQNNVKNISGGANAMVLPIMGRVVEVTDTSDFNKFMEEIVEQTRPMSKSVSDGSRAFNMDSIKTYQVGAYIIIEAQNCSSEAILEAIGKLPLEQQPSMSTELLDWYKDHYSNPTLLLCCFTGTDTLSAQPIMVEYEPRNFDVFLVPGTDDHHGIVPVMGSEIDRDHTLIFGQIKKPTVVMGGNTVKFSQNIHSSLQNGIWNSTKLPNTGKNCDWAYVKDPTSFTWTLNEIITKEDITALF